jgi:hypothetical protein
MVLKQKLQIILIIQHYCVEPEKGTTILYEALTSTNYTCDCEHNIPFATFLKFSESLFKSS